MTDLLAARPDAEPIVLPSPPDAHQRPPLPIVATVVPVAAAVVLWLVTGSPLTLLFAALGPLIAVATMLDGARAARRARRRAAAAGATARAAAATRIALRHDDERATAWARTPDAGTLLQRPADIWRGASARERLLVVGAGEAASATRVVGGGEDADAAALRAKAAVLLGAPVAVPAELGVCVVGAPALATAVARALVLQLCLAHPPERLALVSAPRHEAWASALPHRRSTGGELSAAFVGRGERVPDGADVVVAVAAPGAPVPQQCGAVLTLTGPASAVLEHAAQRRDVSVDALSLMQAMHTATLLAGLARTTGSEVPAAVALAALLDDAPPSADARSLAVPIGRERDGAVATVDLVADGPHAVVAGVTGSGKSELLTTWVAALSAMHQPSEVCFLLADFKGGTAFDPLAALPHVTGVLTDLDGGGARRAVESLRAELRRREAALAAVGARDIRDPAVDLPRLVIVVDEFAALLAEHPELHAVFTDVAARGRALGMHLVLGTQRITGIVRDALLANCPLRISLRVTDAADSRAVIGGDDAARLVGDPASRGLAFVRRAGDGAARLTRIALADRRLLDRLARDARGPAPVPPWLPPLPSLLPLDRVRGGAGGLVLGLSDEPERQRQTVVELARGRDRGMAVFGGPGSGKSTVLDLLAVQSDPRSVVRVPADLEGAWDVVEQLADGAHQGALVLADDVDALAAAFPPDYAAVFLGRLERVARSAGPRGGTVVLAAQRPSGAIGRIAELLPLRCVLRFPSRLEHVSAGGDASTHDPAAPAGRAVIGGRHVQLAAPPAAPAPETRSAPAAWDPRGRSAAVVTRSARAAADALAGAVSQEVVLLDRVAGSAEPAPGVVLVGDPDAWQRHWSLLTRLRAEHDLVVSTSCAGEFRALAGDRGLPPYAEPIGDRAWLVEPSGRVARVRLPGGGMC